MKRSILVLALAVILAGASFGIGRVMATGTCEEIGGIGSGVYAGSECVFAIEPGADPLRLVRALFGSANYNPPGYPATGVPGVHQFMSLDVAAPPDASSIRTYDQRTGSPGIGTHTPSIVTYGPDAVNAIGLSAANNYGMIVSSKPIQIRPGSSTIPGQSALSAEFKDVVSSGDITDMQLMVQTGGIKRFLRVYPGAPDSCGIGKRCLTVMN